MACTLVIKYCKEDCEIIQEEVQSEVYQYPRSTNFIGLNIINETEDDIAYDDINELFKKLEQCNTETLELDVFGSHIFRLLLGNKINLSILALLKTSIYLG